MIDVAETAGHRSCRLTYCHNATRGRGDFYRQLCLALDISPKASAAGVFYPSRFHSLHSRIHWRLHLDHPDDTAKYLRYRMKRAGCERDVFTQDAVQLLHEAVTGGMRDLDRLATGCLREAARRKLVERDLLPATSTATGSSATGDSANLRPRPPTAPPRPGPSTLRRGA